MAATTINNGDTIVGGAGTDTLNITSTATDNISLTGLSVSGVEVVNFTGANNLATVVPVPAAPVAGTRQVQVLDIGTLSLEAEEQTINFVGTTASGTSVVVNVNGTAVTATTVTNDVAATVATAVAAAINTAAATVGNALNGLVSASAASGVVTLRYAVGAGDAAPTTITSGLTGGATITETKTSSAEIQSVALDVTAAGAATNTVSLAGLGTGTYSYALAGAITADATGEAALATAIAGDINTKIAAGNATVGNLVRASSTTDTVFLHFKPAVGDATAVGTFAVGGGTFAAAATIAEVRKGGEVDFTIGINGAQYAVNNVVLDGAILSTTALTAATAQDASKNALRTAINNQLGIVIGDAVTVGVSDQAGEISLASKAVGVGLPTITAVGRDSATNLISIDTADALTVANVVRTGATVQAQQVQYTFGGTVEAGDGANLYINGTNFGAVVATAASTPTGIAAQVATAINGVLGAGVAVAAGGSVTITAPVAGTPLPIISLTEIDITTASMTLARTDVRDNVAALGTTTSTTTAASIAATSFADATDITLVGASSAAASVTAVAATQTVGFRSVTSMTNTVGFAATVTNAALKSEGSSGTLTVTGAGLTSASLTGTTAGSATTVLSLSEGTSTTIDAIRTLNVNTSGATVLNTDGLTALTAVNQTGAGALTLNATGTGATKVASVTTAGGADNIRITTATAVDVVTTTIDETINASVLTGAGIDRVIVETSGAGRTTVDTGDGNDTLVLTSISTGANSLSGGAGNDVFRIGAISTLGTTSINGGDGTDVLRTSTTAFTLADYVTITANVSSIETLQLTGATTALDASKVAMERFEFLAAGTNIITEVQSADRLAAVHTPAALVSFGIPAVGTRVAPSNITASSLGYVVDSNPTLAGEQTTFGENLDITMTHVAENATVVALGNALTLTVGALGIVVGGTAAAPTDVAELNSQVTVTGDIQTLNATLTSARGSGTRSDDPTTTGLGNEAIAKLVVGTPTIDTDGATPGDQGSLDNLTSIVVSGSGEVTINAGQIAALVAKLTSINLSGMTAFSDVNALGQEVSSGATPGGFNNLSTSSVTLNNNVAETVILGGAKDTVITGSVLGAVDTITGFTLVAQAANPLLADTDRSDALDLGAAGGTAFSGAAGGNAAKMVVTGSSLEAALLQAASLKAADGTTNVQNVVFHFGGDTYVFQDRGVVGGVAGSAEGLTADDFLVRLTGLQNLDLLIGGSVLGG